MSHIHNALHGPASRLLRGIKSVLGDTSPDGGVERYSETLQPTYDIFERIDQQMPLGRRFYWRQVAVGAVVGERSILTLRAPTAALGQPGMLIVPQWAKGDGDSWTFRVSNGLLGADAQTTGVTRDLRIIASGNISRSTGLVVSASETSANAGTSLLSFATTEIFLVETGICVISPGQEVRLVGGTDNTASVFAWGWMERVALPGELERTQ